MANNPLTEQEIKDRIKKDARYKFVSSCGKRTPGNCRIVRIMCSKCKKEADVSLGSIEKGVDVCPNECYGGRWPQRRRVAAHGKKLTIEDVVTRMIPWKRRIVKITAVKGSKDIRGICKRCRGKIATQMWLLELKPSDPCVTCRKEKWIEKHWGNKYPRTKEEIAEQGYRVQQSIRLGYTFTGWLDERSKFNGRELVKITCVSCGKTGISSTDEEELKAHRCHNGCH